MIYTSESPSKKIHSIFNMATSRGDLPSRCLSLLEEVKDLIEKHNSEQSGSENSSKIAQSKTSIVVLATDTGG